MRLLGLLLTAVIVLLLAGTALAAPELDQQQGVADGAAELGGPTNGRAGQIVLPAIAGLLTEVHLAVDCEPQATLVVEVRAARGRGYLPGPGTATYASQSIAASSLPPGAGVRAITFSKPAFLAANTPFALVLSATAQECRVGTGPDLYAPGRFFESALPLERWHWRPVDLAFRTFVDRRCRVPVLVGRPARDVDLTLRRNGCGAPRVRRVYSRTVARGRIAAQSPVRGALRPAGTRVSIVVSRGRR